jgi:hypothetical protein
VGVQQLSDQQPSRGNQPEPYDNFLRLAAVVPPESIGQRLDAAAAQLFPDYSRGRLQQWIKSG